MRLAVLCVFVFWGVDLLSICGQAAPVNCNGYYAVACHDDGAIIKYHRLDNDHVTVRIWNENMTAILDEAFVTCDDLPDKDDDHVGDCNGIISK